MNAVVSAPLPVIERALAEFTASLSLPPTLVSAIEYALLGGGKRFRPLLAWHACAACGTAGTAALPACVAIELVHAFSLVHDDLPALDNDDLRRGKPTLHRHADEATAILAGDAMLALAFQALLTCIPDAALSHTLAAELAQGTMGMIAGQVYDTLGGEGAGPTPAEAVRHVHMNKTGALIRASVRMGAMCAIAAQRRSFADPVLGALTRYGEAVGLMFQIADDLLDVEKSSDQAGKRTGKDSAAGKLTYPSVLGVAGSRSQLAALADEARDVLGPLAAGGEPLVQLMEFLAFGTRS